MKNKEPLDKILEGIKEIQKQIESIIEDLDETDEKEPEVKITWNEDCNHCYHNTNYTYGTIGFYTELVCCHCGHKEKISYEYPTDPPKPKPHGPYKPADVIWGTGYSDYYIV